MKQELLEIARTSNDMRHFELDGWQTKVMEHKGNIALRCGRQTGKSTVVSRKARQLAYDYPQSTILILSSSLRQSSLLYEKVRSMLELDNIEVVNKKVGDETFTSAIKKNEAYREAGIFLEKEPTKTRIRLKNGSQIIVEPCGETGAKIRGFTVDFLIVDEAQLVPSAVWVAVIPMLATSKKMRGTGWVIVLGTPAGKHGYYFDCFTDKHYKHFHIPSFKCKRTSKTFLAKEKRRLTDIQYQQEYMAEFVESIRQYFGTDLIKSRVNINEEDKNNIEGKKFLGVDFARFGGDENGYCEAILDKNGNVNIVWALSQKGEAVTLSMGFIKSKDNEKGYNRIFIDSGGLGGSILDVLQETISRRRVIGLDNSQRRFQEEGEEKKIGILKEDLYMNAKILMEQGKINIVNHPLLIEGLKMVSFKFSHETGKVRITGAGRGSHIVEAFVRACWCVKNQGLNLVYNVG